MSIIEMFSINKYINKCVNEREYKNIYNKIMRKKMWILNTVWQNG